MRLTATGKNIEVTPSIRSLLEKKVGKLERYFDPNTEVIVVFSVEKSRHIVEMTIPFDGVLLRGEVVTYDMYESIDNVIEKIEKQIHRHRTRLERKLRADAFKDAPAHHFEPAEQELPRIVRTKRFAIKPMGVEEAVLQMDLLGHSFYVFTNADTEEVNVLYRRKDNNYGLIEPEYN